MATNEKEIKLNAAKTNLKLAVKNIQEMIELIGYSALTDEEVRELRVIRGEISNAHYKLNRMK